MFLAVKDGKATKATPGNARKKKFEKDCFEIRMFHVGHGECVLVSSPDRIAWVIDAGQGTGDKKNDKLAKQIVEYLKEKKLTLQTIVASHPHADHARAFTYLLEKKRPRVRYPLQVIRSNDPGWSPKKRKWLKPFRKALKKNGEDLVIEDFREPFAFGNHIETEVFSNGTTRPFYRSVFIHLRMGDAKVLFTGDAYIPYEIKMRDGFGDEFFKSDVLKVTHHGSADGTDIGVLKTINPGIAIVSTGKPNKSGTGHNLSARTRRVLKKQRVKIFETYLNEKKKVEERDIVLRSDGRPYKKNRGVLYEVERVPTKFEH